jgi:hypothetical protein
MIYKKAQVSIEMAVILGISLIVLAIFFVINTDVQSTFNSKYSNDILKTSLEDLATSGKSIYVQGVGAKTTVTITLPSNVYNASIANRTITFNTYPVVDTDLFVPVYRIVDYNISGTLPNASGTYIVQLTSLGGVINVSYS